MFDLMNAGIIDRIFDYAFLAIKTNDFTNDLSFLSNMILTLSKSFQFNVNFQISLLKHLATLNFNKHNQEMVRIHTRCIPNSRFTPEKQISRSQ